MIAAGRIVKTLVLSVFPASFFTLVPFWPPFPENRRIRIAFLFGSLSIIGLLGLSVHIIHPVSAHAARTQAEEILLALSLKDRIAYVEGLESLVIDSPESLTKLIGLDVALLIGPPHFSRRDGAHVVWQYKTSACILDIYIDTLNAQRQDPKAGPVAYYETRARKQTLPPEKICLSGLLEAARAGRVERLLLSSGDSTDA